MYRIEDWRFSEKLLQSRSGLKIEDSQKNFFNPILDEDWRFPAKLLQSNPGCVRMCGCEDVIEEKQKEVGNRPKNTGWISVDRITKDTLSTYNTWIQISRLQKIYHPHWAKWLFASTPLTASEGRAHRSRSLLIGASQWGWWTTLLSQHGFRSDGWTDGSLFLFRLKIPQDFFFGSSIPPADWEDWRFEERVSVESSVFNLQSKCKQGIANLYQGIKKGR